MGIPFYFHTFYELKALLELVLLVNKNRIEYRNKGSYLNADAADATYTQLSGRSGRSGRCLICKRGD